MRCTVPPRRWSGQWVELPHLLFIAATAGSTKSLSLLEHE